MPRLLFRAAARRDLAAIAAYLEDESESRAVADAFIEKLVHYCEHLAELPVAMGRLILAGISVALPSGVT